MGRPLIGVTTRHDLAGERFYLARHYTEALEAAGGVPLLLPLIPRREFLGRAAEVLEGLLLPGSASDVDPLRYGQEPHSRLKEVHPLRDETDLLLLEMAEGRGIPVLAICYGMQALNVHRGGSLIQDIEAEVSCAVKHEQGVPRDRGSHTVSVREGTRLAGLTNGAAPVVNSHHHQAVGRLGENLRATAWTSDGLVEAFEDEREDRWVLGVQWHPEMSWREDEMSSAIFRSFVEACRGGVTDRRG